MCVAACDTRTHTYAGSILHTLPTTTHTQTLGNANCIAIYRQSKATHTHVHRNLRFDGLHTCTNNLINCISNKVRLYLLGGTHLHFIRNVVEERNVVVHITRLGVWSAVVNARELLRAGRRFGSALRCYWKMMSSGGAHLFWDTVHVGVIANASRMRGGLTWRTAIAALMWWAGGCSVGVSQPLIELTAERRAQVCVCVFVWLFAGFWWRFWSLVQQRCSERCASSDGWGVYKKTHVWVKRKWLSSSIVKHTAKAAK